MAIDIAAYVYYGRPALTASYYDGYGFLEALCPDGMAVIPDTLCVRGLATGSVSTVGGGGGAGDTAGLRCRGTRGAHAGLLRWKGCGGGDRLHPRWPYGAQDGDGDGGRQRCAHGGVRIQL